MNVISESGIVKKYIVNLERGIDTTEISDIEKIFIHSNNKEIYKTNTLSDNTIIYFKIGEENTLNFILKKHIFFNK